MDKDKEQIEKRRAMVKGLTCHHKDDVEEDEDGVYWTCDKDGLECLVNGQCPSV